MQGDGAVLAAVERQRNLRLVESGQHVEEDFARFLQLLFIHQQRRLVVCYFVFCNLVHELVLVEFSQLLVHLPFLSLGCLLS